MGDAVQNMERAKGQCFSISDLVGLYRALEAAAAAIDDRAAKAGTGHIGPAPNAKVVIMRREADMIRNRMALLRAKIEKMPVTSRTDAIQKLRFRLVEFGDDAALAERALSDYALSQDLIPESAVQDLDRRISEVERGLSVLSFALCCPKMDTTNMHLLQSLANGLKKDLGRIRNELDAPPLPLTRKIA